MSKSPWLHVDALRDVGETVVLDADEARHGGRANRLRPGDDVVLSDGRGTTARAELVHVDRRETRALIIEIEAHARDPLTIHLASALPKGDRIATLLSMTTQLGIASFTPLECQRSVVSASAGARTRWERVVRENAKQSHRAWVPELRAATPPDRVVDELAAAEAWLLDPAAETALGGGDASRAQLLLIGPEGGFTDAETRAMTVAGATPRVLGDAVLRIETAAVAAVSVLRAALGG